MIVIEWLGEGVTLRQGGTGGRGGRMPAGLGMRCVQVSTGDDCEVCVSGECHLCGSSGRWQKEQWPGKPLWALHTVQVFWELRVHNGVPNVLRVRRCCKHCDELEYQVLHSASKLTMQLMQAALRQVNVSGVKGGEIDLEKVFWRVLVMEKESELGTNWEKCPGCEQVHSVHIVCPLLAEEKIND